MASRKKAPDFAVVRTIGLFTGKTAIEEANDVLAEEAPAERTGDPTDMVSHGEEAAVRWLGLDAFHEGDDVRVAVHKAGHAVLMLVKTTTAGVAYGTSLHKLSRAQWSKLKQLVKQES